MAKIKFDSTTDYANVLSITKKIFGDVVDRGDDCCSGIAVQNAICKTSAQIDAAELANLSIPANQARYERAVKYAYLTIYPFADNDYNP